MPSRAALVVEMAPEPDVGYESMRRMTMGYGASFSLGMVALTFTAFALGGLRLFRAGGDPVDATEGVGAACFALFFGPLFLIRLVLWKRSPPRVRDAVRTFLVIVECVVAAASLLPIVLVFRTPDAPTFVVAFAWLAALCGGMGLLWVLRYRNEV